MVELKVFFNRNKEYSAQHQPVLAAISPLLDGSGHISPEVLREIVGGELFQAMESDRAEHPDPYSTERLIQMLPLTLSPASRAQLAADGWPYRDRSDT